MYHPSIDIVILSWNRINDTIECVESLLGQKDVVTVITLVDQGSGLETIEKLRKHAKRNTKVKLLEIGKNIGVAAGRNIGMRAGKAEIIISIDNDAVFASPLTLNEIVKIFASNPRLGAAGFRIESYLAGGLDMASWVYPKGLLPKQHEPFSATRFCGAGHAIRRSAYEKTAGYDERLFFYWEELDLSYQLIQNEYTICYEPSIIVRHKIAQEGRAHWRGNRYYYLVRNALYLDWKYFGSPARLLSLAFGYYVKGLYNGTVTQSFRGIRDGMGMIKELKPGERIKLNRRALEYIKENDSKYRGNIWKRLRNEVLAPLPGG